MTIDEDTMRMRKKWSEGIAYAVTGH